MIIDSRDITKEFILERIKQEDIFKKYFSPLDDSFNSIKIGPHYINPLRNDDDNPGCAFYYDNRGMLKFNDFAGGMNIDCFNVVEQLYNCNFKQALIKIYEHFNLIENDKIVLEEIKENAKELRRKNKKSIKVEIKNWNNLELEYWNQYYISKELLSLYNVYPIRRAYVDDKLVYEYSLSDFAFVYFFGRGIIKIYFPLRKKGEMRFVQNDGSILQGSEQLSATGDFCIITKSYKDVIALRTFGIEAVAPMTEKVMISDRQHSILRSRFENLYTLFDFDKTGIRLAAKYRMEYGIPALMFDKNQDEKDFTDNLKKYDYNYMLDYIEETKHERMY